jgi:predicted XRE-type DNA-binding protein
VRIRGETVHSSSGNVFADLGLPDAEGRLAKAKLPQEICALIKSAKFTQTQAARMLGIDQPKVSALIRGRLKDFSTDRLLRFITLLGRDVHIIIQPAQHREHGAIHVLA